MKRVIKFIIEEPLNIIEFLIGTMPGRIGRLVRRLTYKLFLNSVSSNLNIASGVTIKGYSNITFGKNISIMERCGIYASEDHDMIQKTSIVIGDNFFINTNSTLGSDGGQINIGDNVSIAQNVVVRSSNHKHELLEVPINSQGLDSGVINIQSDVWIGANSVILPNVTIGAHSIVAAGSVVSKDVQPYSIVGGVPAKVIKERK